MEQTTPAVLGQVERTVRPLAQMRAWRVYVPSWGSEPQAVSIAPSRRKAQARSHATANGVGYKLKWGDFRVVRAPEFDSWIEQYGTFAWSWEHVQKHRSMQMGQTDKPVGLACNEGLGPLPAYAPKFAPRWPNDEPGFVAEQMMAYALKERAAERELCIAICREVMAHHSNHPDCVPEPGEPGFRDGEACGAEDCIEAIQRGAFE